MRKMPKLLFLPDNSQEYYEKISRILDSLPELADEKNDSDEADDE